MSNDRLRDDVQAIRREMRQAWQEIHKRPIKVKGGGSTPPELRIVILQGNTLATGQLGIKYAASAITDVPTAYDPTTPGTAMNGVGWGELFSDGASQGYVLACNDGSGGTTINFDLLGGSSEQDVGSVATTKTVTVAGDPTNTLTLYIIKSLVG